MKIQRVAAAYIKDGWAVLPVKPGTKEPYAKDWQKQTFSPIDFNDGDNISFHTGEASAHHIDVDVDHPAALPIAAAFLPRTGRIHGRPGKPASHYWYRCKLTKSYEFKLTNALAQASRSTAVMLLELRSDRHQTVVPPSVWTSKDDPTITEVLRWESEGMPLELDEPDLVLTAQAISICTLLSLFWPAEGGRHAAVGHMAGFLARQGLSTMWVTQIIRHAAQIAGDPEVEDRVRIAAETVEKHLRGEKTTGGPTVKDSWDHGADLIDVIQKWMGREADANDDVLEALNRQYFVALYGRDVAVGVEAEDGTTDFMTCDALRRLLYNQRVGKQRLGEWWLSHPLRRQYDKVVFAPPPLTAPANAYNLYKGFACTPDPDPHPEQRCSLILTHMYKVLCQGHEVNYIYMLDWHAAAVQCPGRPSGASLVLQGDPGAGKGLHLDNFGQIFGSYYIQISDSGHLTGKFNSHLSGKIFIFADEAMWGGTRKDVGQLKRLQTERTLAVEKKYLDTITIPNTMHLAMASNEERIYPATRQERRAFILTVKKHKFQTAEYYEALQHEWSHGGREAFLAFLLARPGVRVPLPPPPRTEALSEQMALTNDEVTSWWEEKLAEGSVEPGKAWPDWVAKVNLYYDYLDHCAALGNRNSSKHTQKSFMTALRRLWPKDGPISTSRRITCPRRYRSDERVNVAQRGWSLPPLDLCRQAFDTQCGVTSAWEPVAGDDLPVLQTKDDDDDL